MQSKVVRTLALALVLVSVGITLGQNSPLSGGRQPPEKAKSQGANAPRSEGKSKLEEMLSEALKNNPDIRVATANLALAEAELNRTRLQVTQKIVALNQDIDSARKAVEYAKEVLAAYESQYKSGQLPFEKVVSARTAFVSATAKLAAAEAELPYVLGKVRKPAAAEAAPQVRFRYQLGFNHDGDLDLSVAKAKVNIPHSDKLRKALQTPVKVDYKDMTFDAILKDLSKKVAGLSFRNLFSSITNSAERKLSLRFEEALPVSAILQALKDETNCSFFVREYGILATGDGNVPSRALTVEEFLRQKPAQK